MICEPIDSEHWRLSFSELEAGFIISVLAQMGSHYQEDVDKMPTSQRAYWQGSVSRNSSPNEEGLRESQEMISEARAELRSERLNLVENWVREFELAEDRDPWTVEISGTERDEFVSMLNDRRMLLALELGITEAEMEVHLVQIPDERRRQAIFDIEVLGHFILATLGPQIYRP